MTAEAFAPAKINLTLHVTGQRADGYHLLDSLVAFADIGDRLLLTPGADLSLEVTGTCSDGVPTDARNLARRAAEALGWTGHIALDKVLPHGAGLGGGSADAAAVLRALEACGISVPEGLPVSLGADVPVCRLVRAARMQGIGERIAPVGLPALPALLVNPGAHVPTGSVFSALARRDNPGMPAQIPDFEAPPDCADWLKDQRNDLEVPAIGIAPVIDRALADLRRTSEVLIARMSGSGSTCFALYPTMKAAHAAAYEIGAEHPDWWCYATELR
ncbi:4-diphosphocytidyl-2-C-methyl-D-erythritol kinase [Cribrihabitans marinus]|uniref:4-diphosphocytidyl-2-C-methyl-D-erythritol kinase n=1 Tax=Cribrihabitans marinus TaxID=1227549 RepID=A0A1H7CE49_9RHOB|nr:4-(cytidine 5'-diphospho)-2-C-methyl-D-erythritol kinase [Cribrihabitans marinus]GGH35246.1 4-diphosphocytidyl-2-C-methyl-D-erythritol kinase [Cribrihabitans marinus]SEJ87989.1 4-diphosphocytidyl-2-C-methyl-D-erythritol kinase [Cribrihabitans marinus]